MCAETRAQRPEPSGPAPGFLDSIRPLQIGDTIPEALWHLPLQVVNHLEGRDTIILNDYRDTKLIILDFWATWCVPCIKSLGKLDSLQKRFGEELTVLPATYEDASRAEGKLTDMQLQLSSVVNDSILRAYFPHKLVPHQVWIKDGKIEAIADATYANSGNVKNLLENRGFGFAAKEDVVDYSPYNSLAIYADRKEAPVYSSSTFTGFIEGVPSVTGERKAHGAIFLNYTNVSAMMMYGRLLGVPNNRLVVRSADPEDFIYRSGDRGKLFCYQLRLPSRVSGTCFKKRALNDLNNHFALTLDTQTLPVDCYIIRKGASVANSKWQAGTPQEKRKALPAFVALLNHTTLWTPAQPIFIDESGYKGEIASASAAKLRDDLSRLRTLLSDHGLSLVRQQRMIKMYVLTAAKYNNRKNLVN